MKKLLLFGSARITRLLHFFISEEKKHEIAAFVVDEAYKSSDSFCSLPLVSAETVTERYPPDSHEMLVALGYNNLNAIRKAKYLAMKSLGYKLISYIHPSNIVASNVEIGENTIIMESNVIQPFAKIGNNVLIFSKNNIAHDCVIEDHACITGLTNLSGESRVGESSFISINSTIGTFVKVGKNCVIGAHTWLNNDTEDDSVYQSMNKTVKRKFPSSKVRIK